MSRKGMRYQTRESRGLVVEVTNLALPPRVLSVAS